MFVKLDNRRLSTHRAELDPSIAIRHILPRLDRLCTDGDKRALVILRQLEDEDLAVRGLERGHVIRLVIPKHLLALHERILANGGHRTC